MPRLALEDQAIFLNILSDMFPGTPKPKCFQEIRLKEMFPDPASVGIIAPHEPVEDRETDRSKDGTRRNKDDIHFKLFDIA